MMLANVKNGYASDFDIYYGKTDQTCKNGLGYMV